MISDRNIRTALERFRFAIPASGNSTGTALEVVLDATMSMTTGDGSKESLARELSMFLLQLGEPSGIRTSLTVSKGGGRDRVIPASDVARLPFVAFDAVEPFSSAGSELAHGAAAPTYRVVVSDLLIPADFETLVARFARHVAQLWIIQILAAADRDPEAGGRMLLRDLETDETVEVTLDEASIEGYRSRLNQLCDRIKSACQATGATLVTVLAEVDLNELCDQYLVPAGLIARTTA